MVREFYIENELGQRFSLMDMENDCFFNSPAGLGYSYDIEYAQIGNEFIQNIRKISQGAINGELVFNSYIFNDYDKKDILEEVIDTISLSVNDNYDVDEVVFYVDKEEICKSVLKTIE